MSGFVNDLTASARDFYQIVWPELQKHQWFAGGTILPSEAATVEVDRWVKHTTRGHVMDESATAKLVRSLDCLCGIDAWHLDGLMGMRGIASRVQWNQVREGGRVSRAYRSFTVRYARQSGMETEWAKMQRLHALRSDGWVSAHFRIQAYLDKPGGALLCAFAAKQSDIAALCRDELIPAVWTIQPNRDERGRSVDFAVMWVDALRERGVEVAEFGEHAASAARRRGGNTSTGPLLPVASTSIGTGQTHLPLYLAPTLPAGVRP